MALTRTAVGTGGNNTAATSVTVSVAANLPAGSIGILVASADNAGSGGATTVWPATITDSVGNTWTLRQNPIYDPGAASAGVDLAFYTGAIVTPLTTAGSIVINFAAAVSVTAKAWALSYFTGAAGSVLSYVTGAAGTGSATGTPTITTGSIASGDAVVGGGGAESASTWTGDADTTNGSWSAQQAAGFGTTTSGMSVTTQAKIVTATAAQTYNPTLTSADCILGWIQIHEEVVTAISASDSGAGTDVSSSTAAATATDAGSGVELSTEAAATTRTEAGVGAEASLPAAAYATSDSGTAADASAYGEIKLVGDAGAGNDLAALLSSLALADVGVAVDSSLTVAANATVDSGTGADTSATTATLVVTDPGSSADVSSPAAALARSDTGVGGDAGAATELGTNMDFVRADAGTGSDTASLMAAFAASDTATAADMGTLGALTVVIDAGFVLEVVVVSTGGPPFPGGVTGRVSSGGRASVSDGQHAHVAGPAAGGVHGSGPSARVRHA